MSFLSTSICWHVGAETPDVEVKPGNGHDVHLTIVPHTFSGHVQGSLSLLGTPDDICAALEKALAALDEAAAERAGTVRP